MIKQTKLIVTDCTQELPPDQVRMKYSATCGSQNYEQHKLV
jgi:hypothetical protein